MAKKVLVFSFLFQILLNSVSAQTVLAPGDIAVIGIKTSGDDLPARDKVRLLILKNLECGTRFIVTDNNWNAGTSSWFCDNDEAAIEVTVTQEILAGAVMTIDFDDPVRPAPVVTSGIGAATDVSLGNPWGTNLGLNSRGDNVLILQGTRAAPTFIYALRHIGTFASGGNCGTKDNTGLPPGLTLGTTAIQLGTAQRKWHYNCSLLNIGTKAALLNSISNVANWNSYDNNANNFFTLANHTTNCAFTVTDAVWGPPVTGSIGVSGAGCGCLNGCNLTSLGGPNCSPSVAGDCSAGYQSMSVDIPVPSGCTYSVIATMRSWTAIGCGSSGADGNCGSCDRLKVDLPAGGKAFRIGGSNATLNDSYTLTGPGTIRVSGGANRADEIIVYRILSSPCASCGTFVLPIELLDFTAKPQGSAVLLEWRTASETNNDFYTIERSANGTQWEAIGTASAVGNSSEVFHYHRFDSSPLAGVSYYRLRQTDLDGTSTLSNVVAVKLAGISGIESSIRTDQDGTWLDLIAEMSQDALVELYDLAGRIVLSNEMHLVEGHQSMRINLGFGAYVLAVRVGDEVITHKIILH